MLCSMKTYMFLCSFSLVRLSVCCCDQDETFMEKAKSNAEAFIVCFLLFCFLSLEIRVRSQMMLVTCSERKFCFLDSRRNHRMDRGYRYINEKFSQVGKIISSILEEIKMGKNLNATEFSPWIFVTNVYSSKLVLVVFNFIILHMSATGQPKMPLRFSILIEIK